MKFFNIFHLKKPTQNAVFLQTNTIPSQTYSQTFSLVQKNQIRKTGIKTIEFKRCYSLPSAIITYSFTRELFLNDSGASSIISFSKGDIYG